MDKRVIFERPATGTRLDMVTPVDTSYHTVDGLIDWSIEHLGSAWKLWGMYLGHEARDPKLWK